MTDSFVGIPVREWGAGGKGPRAPNIFKIVKS